MTRVPGSKKPHTLSFGKIDQRQHFADRHARRFLQENVPTPFQRVAGEFVTHLRRRAQRHCLNLGDRVQQCRQVAEARHPVELVMRAGNGNELECIARPKGRNVLVTGDLAEADDCDFDFSHELPVRVDRDAARHLQSIALRYQIQRLLDELAHGFAGRGRSSGDNCIRDLLVIGDAREPDALVSIRHADADTQCGCGESRELRIKSVPARVQHGNMKGDIGLQRVSVAVFGRLHPFDRVAENFRSSSHPSTSGSSRFQFFSGCTHVPSRGRDPSKPLAVSIFTASRTTERLAPYC